MPHIAPQLRHRNANGTAAPVAAPSEQYRADAGAGSAAPDHTGRGAELAVRILWLVLGVALGFSAGMIWSASVLNVG